MLADMKAYMCSLRETRVAPKYRKTDALHCGMKEAMRRVGRDQILRCLHKTASRNLPTEFSHLPEFQSFTFPLTVMASIARPDGRKVNELRRITIVYEGLARADGSARFGFGMFPAFMYSSSSANHNLPCRSNTEPCLRVRTARSSFKP